MSNQPSNPKQPKKPTEATKPVTASAPEAGGPKGLEPTRYGDWERNGKCVDF